VIVVEAGEKSGSLTTAYFAEKYNREIFAVPTRIDEPNGKGTNSLLERTAKPYLGIMSLNVIEQASDQTKRTKPIKNYRKSEQYKEENLTSNEKKLLKLLGEVPKQRSEFQNILDLSINHLEELLFNLELKGKLKVHGEKIFPIK
jgi:DNA processing protein